MAVNDYHKRACNTTGVGNSELLIAAWSRVPNELVIFVPKSVTVLQEYNTGLSANIINILHPTLLFTTCFYYYHSIYDQFFQVILLFFFTEIPNAFFFTSLRAAAPWLSRLVTGLIAEARVRFQVRPCGIFGGRYTISADDIVVK